MRLGVRNRFFIVSLFLHASIPSQRRIKCVWGFKEIAFSFNIYPQPPKQTK